MSYRVERTNRLFEAFCLLPEKELTRPGVTVTFNTLVDLSAINQLRESAPSKEERISYTAFIAKALALTLHELPYGNRRVFKLPWVPFGKRRLVSFQSCDIAIAAERDFPGAEYVAFVDILRDADKTSLPDIKRWLRALAEADENSNKQWRDFMMVIKRFPSALASLILRFACWFPGIWVKYRGAAALISSPGKYGHDNTAAMWAWPLGVTFGMVKLRPVVKEGNLQIVPSFYLTMNFDRRVMAGGPAARLFNRMVELLENPATLT